MKPSSFAKPFAGSLSLVYFVFNCALANVPEANFWEQRKKLIAAAVPAPIELPRVQRSALPTINTSLRAQIPSSKKNLLEPLVAALSGAYGQVKEITVGGNGPVVIHIQDVHRNPEAQRNIANTLRELMSRGEVDLVALEGHSGFIGLNAFQQFPDRVNVQRVADYLLKENKISGPVHAGMLTEKNAPAFIGVDNGHAYRANVKAYLDSAPLLKSCQEQLALMADANRSGKEKAFNPALKKFDALVQSHRQGTTGLGEYVKALASVRDSNELSRSVELFLRALDMESRLDFARVETERATLLKELLQKLDKADSGELLSQTVAYRLSLISNGDFYRSLSALCEKHGISLARYASLRDYLQYVILADGIDAEDLLNDLPKLETAAYDSLAQAPEEKRLVAESKRLFLVGKLLDFSLTTAEWNEYGEAAEESSLDLSTFEAFYDNAIRRDRLMVDNLLGAAKSRGARVAVLVTGGFHSTGMEEHLRSAGLSVIRFVPKITKIDSPSGTAYLSVFAQEKTPLEKMFQGEKLFLAENPAAAHALRVLGPTILVCLVDSAKFVAWTPARIIGRFNSGRLTNIHLVVDKSGAETTATVHATGGDRTKISVTEDKDGGIAVMQSSLKPVRVRGGSWFKSYRWWKIAWIESIIVFAVPVGIAIANAVYGTSFMVLNGLPLYWLLAPFLYAIGHIFFNRAMFKSPDMWRLTAAKIVVAGLFVAASFESAFFIFGSLGIFIITIWHGSILSDPYHQIETGEIIRNPQYALSLIRSDASTLTIERPDFLNIAWISIRRIANRREEKVIQGLLPLLEDKRRVVRSTAAEALGDIAQAEDNIVISALLPLLQDNYPDVSVPAISALGKIVQAGDNRVIVELLILLRHYNGDIRSAAVAVLKKLNATQGQMIEGYLSALKSDSSDARSSAAEALVKIVNTLFKSKKHKEADKTLFMLEHILSEHPLYEHISAQISRNTNEIIGYRSSTKELIFHGWDDPSFTETYEVEVPSDPVYRSVYVDNPEYLSAQREQEALLNRIRELREQISAAQDDSTGGSWSRSPLYWRNWAFKETPGVFAIVPVAVVALTLTGLAFPMIWPVAWMTVPFAFVIGHLLKNPSALAGMALWKLAGVKTILAAGLSVSAIAGATPLGIALVGFTLIGIGLTTIWHRNIQLDNPSPVTVEAYTRSAAENTPTARAQRLAFSLFQIRRQGNTILMSDPNFLLQLSESLPPAAQHVADIEGLVTSAMTEAEQTRLRDDIQFQEAFQLAMDDLFGPRRSQEQIRWLSQRAATLGRAVERVDDAMLSDDLAGREAKLIFVPASVEDLSSFLGKSLIGSQNQTVVIQASDAFLAQRAAKEAMSILAAKSGGEIQPNQVIWLVDEDQAMTSDNDQQVPTIYLSKVEQFLVVRENAPLKFAKSLNIVTPEGVMLVTEGVQTELFQNAVVVLLNAMGAIRLYMQELININFFSARLAEIAA